MNTEGIKQLMLFYLMDVDLIGYHYAAVDTDCLLCVYKYKPVLQYKNSTRINDFWIPYEEWNATDNNVSVYASIKVLDITDFDYTQTLIEL